MSIQTKVSDAEMRFFQFRARQLLLLRREDHEWQEFCKRNTCTCCSCQAATQLKTTKEMGVQASPKKPPTRFADRNAQNIASVQGRTLPQALNEIKTKLERIDLALSGRTALTREEQTVNRIFPEIKFPRNIGQEESLQNPTNVKRMELIQRSLKQSLQRLQSSSAVWKNPRPSVIPKKKNSSFFLPHELQKQRTVARSAYLASLAKSKSKQQPSSSIVKEKVSSKQVNPQEKTQRPKVVPKTRNKSNLQLKKEEKQEDNLVASSQLKDVNDENIEIAVDGIVDDLMGETVLLLNKMKQIKSEKSANGIHHTQAEDAALPTILPFEERAEEQNVKLQPSSNWAKIRQSLLHFKMLPEEKSSIQNSKHSSLEDENIHAGTLPTLSQSTLPQTLVSNHPASGKRELFIDLQIAQDIVRHRREYARYLEKISRTKKGNFDPWTLANMISEFLLDECTEEVSKELLDVPGSLITDLYDQEFLQTLCY